MDATPVQKLEDAKTTEIVMGAQAPGSTQYDYPVLLNRLFGYKFKVITGYESTPKRFTSPWSAARCKAPSPTGRRSRQSAPTGSPTRRCGIISQWALQKNAEIERRAAHPRHRQERSRQAGAAARPLRGLNTGGRSSYRRACRRIASRRCDARSTPRSRIRRSREEAGEDTRSTSMRSQARRCRNWSSRSRTRQPTSSPASATRWRANKNASPQRCPAREGGHPVTAERAVDHRNVSDTWIIRFADDDNVLMCWRLSLPYRFHRQLPRQLIELCEQRRRDGHAVAQAFGAAFAAAVARPSRISSTPGSRFEPRRSC